tara:strand:- start:444 stop:1064 length:621 start_codon:yes stop_codon:yes gene_type:complete
METEIKEKKSFFDILKQNLKVILSILLVLLIGLGFYLWIQYNSNLKKQDLSEKYIQAKILLSKNDKQKSLEILKNIIKEKDSTYSILSLYLIIDKNLENDDNSILNYFDKIITISDLEKEDVNLIKLKKAIFISGYGKEDKLLELLNPIINSDSVWKVQATKFMGDYYFSRKEYVKADQFYSKLINLEGENIDKNEINRKIQTYKK